MIKLGLNRQGFSLVEVLMTLALVSIVFVVMNSMIIQLVYQQEKLNAKQELFTFVMDVQTQLSSPFTCKTLIGEENFSPNRIDMARQSPTADPSTYFKGAPGATASFDVLGTHVWTEENPILLGNSRLTVEHLRWVNLQDAGFTPTGDPAYYVQIYAQVSARVGRQTVPFKPQVLGGVMIVVDGANEMSDCFPATAGNTQLLANFTTPTGP